MNRKTLWFSGGALLVAALLLWYFTTSGKKSSYMSLVPQGASAVAIFNPVALFDKAGNPEEWHKNSPLTSLKAHDTPLPMAGLLSPEGFQNIRNFIDPVKQGVAFHFRDHQTSVWGMAIPLAGKADEEGVLKQPAAYREMTNAKYKSYRLLISDQGAVAIRRDVMWILLIDPPTGVADVRKTMERFLSGSFGRSYFENRSGSEIKLTKGADVTIFGSPEAFSDEGPLPLSGIGLNEWLEAWQADVTFEQGAVDLVFSFTPRKEIQPYLQWIMGNGISQASFSFHARENILMVAALAADSGGFNTLPAATSQWLDREWLPGLNSKALLQHMAGNLVVSISHPDAAIGKMLNSVLYQYEDVGNPFLLLKPEVRISFDVRSTQDAEALVAELQANHALVADGKLFRITGNIPGIPAGVITPLYMAVNDSKILISNRKDPLSGKVLVNPASSHLPVIIVPEESQGAYLFLNAERISELMAGFAPEEGRGAAISLFQSIILEGTQEKLHVRATMQAPDVNSLQLLLPWIVSTDI